ncbi:hypothetical protein G9A89_011398 [Geosiphon pyriformis]|nr:hypothetical protein G9A89_011398 [Geosiphon pyriformis]
MLALKTIPELSITITEKHINYTQTEIVANLAPNSRNYHLYKKKTRSYSGIHLPKLLKLALRENLLLASINILPNATIQQKLQLCFNEENSKYPPIYRYFYIGKTLHKQKWELIAANLTKKAIQKQIHNEFKTTAGPTNSCYKLRAALRLYDLFYTCENVLQNPILQPLKIQYIGKLTELEFQKFSDQIFSIILDYYLEITDNIHYLNFAWGEQALRCSAILLNASQQDNNRRSPGSKIDAIIMLTELGLEFSVLEVSSSPSNSDHTHYVGDRNKIAKNLKIILNFIRKKHTGNFEQFRKIKVYGIQIYDKSFYIYTMSMPFHGIYYFKQEFNFECPTNSFLAFKTLPKFLSSLWRMRDIIISSAEDIISYVASSDQSGDEDELDPVNISPKKKRLRS